MKFTFYFPYKILSGVPILFSNVANFIVSNYPDIDIAIIDYEGGPLWELTNSEKVQKIRFIDGVKVSPDPDSYLIMQAILPFSIRPELELSDNQKILFWHLHPNNLKLNNITKVSFLDILINQLRVVQKNKMKKFIKILDNSAGLIYMDGPNFNNTSRLYNLKLNKRFVPILIKDYSSFIFEKNELNKDAITLNFSYIGRIADFKYYPLKKLLLTINELIAEKKINRNIHFYVIGDGPLKSRLESITKKLDFSVTFEGVVPYDKVPQLLLNKKININFAMGTSALDSSKLGVPTVILNYSYKEIDKYPKYQWIFNETNYSVGYELETDNLSHKNKISILKLIDELGKSRNMIEEGTRKYFEINYSSEAVISEFFRYVTCSNLTYKQIKSFRKSSLIRKIYHYHKYKKFKRL